LQYGTEEITLSGTFLVTTLQAPDKQQLPAHAEQLRRQEEAEWRARDAAMSQARRLKEMGKESCLSYGQRLFKMTLQAVTLHLNNEFALFAASPYKARRWGNVMPVFDVFKGPEHIAAIALVAGIDQLSRRQRYPTFCQNLGTAIERETRLITLDRVSRVEMRHLMRTGMSRPSMAKAEVMGKLGAYQPRWTDRQRLDVGAFLADVLIQSSELFWARKHRIGRRLTRVVVPSRQALEFIQASRVPAWSTPHSAMVCQPVPWFDLWGGGHLGNMECLIRVPIQDAEDQEKATEHYRQADMTWLLGLINWLQATPIHVSGEMISVARTAWEGGFDGLWPCSRAPMRMPERLGDDPDPAELRARNRLAAIAHRDQEQNRPRRIKIERALQVAEGLRDRTVWQAYHCDHRGRIYSGNRYVTHQGPDYEKSFLSFEEKLPVGNDGIDWILKAAAGHYGLGHSSWDERLRWGQENREQMLAAASNPLDRLELWRSAKEPWQYLQLCKGLKEALETGRSGVPIRFDQTTSGPGILAALVRDREVGRLCNLFGSTRRDLYSAVADKVRKRLQQDLEFGDTRERTLAEIWLGRGIDRGLLKGPVMSVPYGGSYQSVCDKLVAALDEHLGFVPLDEFKLRVAMPSKYLGSIVWAELKEAVTSVNSVKKWLKLCCKELMKHQYPLWWKTPMGWPMLIADREVKRLRVETWLYGQKVSMNIVDQPGEAQLSSTQANKGLPANLIHSFDAAFCHAVISKAVTHKFQLLTNHDCFAVHPCNAGSVHKLLHEEFRVMYREDWLAAWRTEVQWGTGVELPLPPMVNTLEPGLIGTNDYLFS